MTVIREFRATDLIALDLQPEQRGVLGIYEPDISFAHGFALEHAGPAYTAVSADGRVLASAGLAECFRDRQATAWAMFARGWWEAVDRKAVIRALRAGLESAPYARIEALSRAARPEEGRLLQFVGMRRVAPLKQWGPNSETVVLYERLGPVIDASGTDEGD